MSDILNTILSDTYTLTQLKHRLRILKNYLLKNFFGGDMKLAEAATADLNWLKSLDHTFYQNFHQDNVYDIFTNLEAEIKKISPLTIYLTFEPDSSTCASIGMFARKRFNSSLILDIKYDPSLIAGAALVWKGVYKDYSLRAKIAEKKTEILQSFKRFLR